MKDEIKEELAEFRFWRSIIVGLIIAILGWIFTSLYGGLYSSYTGKILLVSASVFALILCTLLAFATKNIFAKIKAIGRL